jgi:tyrosine-protein kinase
VTAVGDESINLRDQVAVLRRRWRIVVLCTVGGLLAAAGLAFLQSPQYRSSTRLEISPVSAAQTANNGVVMQPSEISTQMQVMLSTPVATRVVETLKLDVSPADLLKSMSVAQEGDTRVISVTALRPSSKEAQEVADTFATEYLSFRSEQATAQSRASMAALTDEAQKVRDRLNQIQQELPGASGAQANQLQSEQQVLLVQLTQILGDLATASLSTPNGAGDAGQVLEPASRPTKPAEPQPVRSGLLGMFLGLLLGVGLAFVRDHFDDGVRDEYRLREVLAPRPVLGRIPHWANARSGRLATVIDPASQVSEAYRALSTSVRFMLAVPRDGAHRTDGGQLPPHRLAKAPLTAGARSRGKVLLVTSPMQSEGKTSLASNLAVVAARFGLRVVLVDADLRNPQLAGVFGLGRPPGLSDLLASDDDVDDYLVEVEDMRILPGGSLAPNPAELLASPRMSELLTTLSATTDLVVIDTAPVTQVSDALELVADSDVVLLVARHGQTRLRSVVEAVEKIHQVGGEVSAAVYVDVPVKSGADAYGYGYGASAEAAPSPPEVTPGGQAPAVVVVPAEADAPGDKQSGDKQSGGPGVSKASR